MTANALVGQREQCLAAGTPGVRLGHCLLGQPPNPCVAFAGTQVQLELLRQGLARVDISPDRGECYSELYAAEGEARAAHAGIWALPAYAIRTPDTLQNDVGTFQIVFGKVLAQARADVKVERFNLDGSPIKATDTAAPPPAK